MVLEEETKIIQSKNAYTQYFTIPTSIVRGSHTRLKQTKNVKIIVDFYPEIMIIVPIKGPNIRVSSGGIIIDKGRVEIIEK
jgi:hypothetical protein